MGGWFGVVMKSPKSRVQGPKLCRQAVPALRLKALSYFPSSRLGTPVPAKLCLALNQAIREGGRDAHPTASIMELKDFSLGNSALPHTSLPSPLTGSTGRAPNPPLPAACAPTFQDGGRTKGRRLLSPRVSQQPEKGLDTQVSSPVHPHIDRSDFTWCAERTLQNLFKSERGV
jgi:hypothetical protein